MGLTQAWADVVDWSLGKIEDSLIVTLFQYLSEIFY